MIIHKKSVLLCKAAPNYSDDLDEYESILQENGFSSYTIPVLDFRYEPIDLDGEEFNLIAYSGIIFTSPRAVIPVKQLFKEKHECISIPVYVVGKTTAKLVENELLLKTIGGECGNADNLADLIIEHHKTSSFIKPFLFLCGNIKMDILPKKFASENILLKPVIVYETTENEQFEEKFNKFTKSGSECSEFVVFFSPSGIKYSLPIFNKLNIDILKIKFIAIGPTTAKCMIDHSIQVSAIADKPTPNALVEAVKLTVA